MARRKRYARVYLWVLLVHKSMSFCDDVGVQRGRNMSKMQYEVVGTSKGNDNEADSIIRHEMQGWGI